MQNLKINNSIKSPNFGTRLNNKIDTLVIHFTEMKSAEAAIERLCDPKAVVSSHYIIAKSGEVFNLVDDEKKAHHAGVSYWRGQEAVNDFSIGIELDNNGNEAFSTLLMDSLIDLCHYLINKYKIKPQNIVGHSDVAPTRKVDPGILFEWDKLAANSIGIMPQMELFSPTKPLPKIQRIIQLMQDFGYNAESMSDSPEKLTAHLIAFSTHYLRTPYQEKDLARIEFALENMLSRLEEI